MHERSLCPTPPSPMQPLKSKPMARVNFVFVVVIDSSVRTRMTKDGLVSASPKPRGAGAAVREIPIVLCSSSHGARKPQQQEAHRIHIYIVVTHTQTLGLTCLLFRHPAALPVLDEQDMR